MFNLQRHAEIVGELMVLYLRCEICFNFVHLARQSPFVRLYPFGVRKGHLKRGRAGWRLTTGMVYGGHKRLEGLETRLQTHPRPAARSPFGKAIRPVASLLILSGS